MNTRLMLGGFLLLSTLGLAGCGSRLPPAADADTARTTLKEALDAWKKGDTPEDLKNRSRSIQVNDRDWRAGRVLTSFKIGPDDTLQGLARRFSVELTLSGGKKFNGTYKVAYLVTTEPAATIVREEE